jgi:hypothetical protein
MMKAWTIYETPIWKTPVMLKMNFNFKDMLWADTASIRFLTAGSAQDYTQDSRLEMRMVAGKGCGCRSFFPKKARAESLLKSLQEGIRLRQTRKSFLLGMKFGGVNAAAAAAELHRMLEVEHFVIDHIFQGIKWNREMVEYTADDDGIVCRVIVAEDAPGTSLTPAHSRAREQTMEKTNI